MQGGFRRVLAVGAIEVTIHEATFWGLGLGAQVGCYLYVAVTKKNDMSGFGKKSGMVVVSYVPRRNKTLVNLHPTFFFYLFFSKNAGAPLA